jgi:hypothetical protein
MRTSLLSVDAINLDFQPSENLSEDIVSTYVDKLRRGDQLPPVRVRYYGTNYFLEDGFHRIQAMRLTGIKQTEAEIRPGTIAEMEAEFARALRAALDMLKRS